MKKFLNPQGSLYSQLLERPKVDVVELAKSVRSIMQAVKQNGDAALQEFNSRLDQYEGSLALDALEIEKARELINPALKEAIDRAYDNVFTFHQSQQSEIKIIETSPGVLCWRESRPIERVGLYIPGGTAPLFSTVLMLGIPAQIAGAKELILCSPPNREGALHPAILYAASLCGIKNIYLIGGAQAIAALTFGTESIPQVDKIFGPGNSYVTAAKQEALSYGRAIDMPAGPSELLVIADEFADPSFVAADLLSQAEHGTDSQVLLCSDSEKLVDAVLEELSSQLILLDRSAIAAEALKNSSALVFSEFADCFTFSDKYAPEHLIVNARNAYSYREQINTAGSVFLGPFSAESIGDYASGTNHTLPTAAFARTYSGLSLESFQKQIQFQEISEAGLRNIGPLVSLMAEAEALGAHKRAVDIRLEKINKSESDV